MNKKRGLILFFEKVIYLLFLISLIFLSIYDKRKYVIPEKCNLCILCLGFLRSFLVEESFLVPILGIVYGGSPFLLVYLLQRKRGIGGGDVKLAAAGGSMLGSDILVALFLACLFAVGSFLFSVYREWKIKRNCGQPMKINDTYSIAFGPFLSLGMEILLLKIVLIG